MIDNPLIIIISYMALGASLKYIDQIYDVHIFEKKAAMTLAIFSGLLMGSVIAFDDPSKIILSGIILSVLLTGKIDNKAFLTVVILSAAIPVFYISLIDTTYKLETNMLLSGIFLVALGVTDEYMDKIGDQRHIKILTTRPMMKIGVLILCILSIFSYTYLIAFIGFDLSYMFINVYSSRKVKELTRLEIKAKGIMPEHL